MKSKIKGIYFFILGILVTGIDINIATKISYGFRFGVNEGVKKGFNTYFLEALIGDHFRIDILFNPAGYLLILLGLALMHGNRKYMMNMKAAAVLGFVISTVKTIFPFVLSQYSLFGPILFCCVAEILVMLVIMYSFTLACKKQVDNFKYLEVGKDLTFATELYGFASVIKYVIMPFAALYIYFARGAYILTIVLSWAAVLYFVYKTFRYVRTLYLFESAEKEEEI